MICRNRLRTIPLLTTATPTPSRTLARRAAPHRPAARNRETPTVVDTEKAPTDGAALAELKAEGECPDEAGHRRVEDLNNAVPADPGKLRRPIRPVRDFMLPKTVREPIKGFQVTRALREDQAPGFNVTRDARCEAGAND